MIRGLPGLGAVARLLAVTVAGGADAAAAGSDPNAADCFINPRAVSAAAPDDVWVVGTVMEPNPTANFAGSPMTRSPMQPAWPGDWSSR